MKKTYAAVIAIVAVLLIAVTATAAYYSQVQGAAGDGQLAILGADPLIAASGVTDAQVQYTSVAAHTAGSAMSSGWVQVSGSRTMDLMASGSAQTIATAKVKTGAYDAFRFTIDSAKVTYQAHVYTATVASPTVTAVSQSRVQVNQSSSATATAIVYMASFIQNTGNSSSPAFVLSATANATSVPPSALVSVRLSLGVSLGLSGSWWNSFVASTTTQATLSGTLTNGNLAVVVYNAGAPDIHVQEVIISPISASAYASSSLPASLSGSAVFDVVGSGSLQSETSASAVTLANTGATIASGSSATLNYNGNVNLDFGGVSQVTGVVAGQQYIVTAIGANTYTSAIVVAS